MFTFILLFATVTADWVEISQYHKETPLRINDKPPLKLLKKNNPPFQPDNEDQTQEIVIEKPRRVISKPSSKFSENTPPFRTQKEPSIEKPPDRMFPFRKHEEAIEPSWIRKKPALEADEDQKEIHVVNKPLLKSAYNVSPLKSYHDSSHKFASKEILSHQNPTLSETKIHGNRHDSFKTDYDRVTNKRISSDRNPEDINTRKTVLDEGERRVVKSNAHEKHVDRRTELEISKDNRKFPNSSLSENWNKGTIKKIPKFGNVQRVHIDSTTKKPEHFLDDYNSSTEVHTKDKLLNNKQTTTKYNNFKKQTKDQNENTSIEVFNLSDIEYTSDEDVLPTTETGDDIKKTDHMKYINKHLVESLPTKPSQDGEFNENMDKKHVEKLKLKSTTENTFYVSNDHIASLHRSDMNAESDTNFKDINLKTDNNVINQKFKADINKSIVTFNNKTFVPIKRITIPDPEEVMIKEILEAESNIRTNMDHETNTQNTKEQNENRNKLTTPKSKTVPNNSDVDTSIVKKLAQAQITAPDEDLILNDRITDKNINKYINIHKISNAVGINFNKYKDNKTLVDKELGNIYMNENVEIIRQVQVTSTEEIPIRTTIKIKPFKDNEEPQETNSNYFTEPNKVNQFRKSHHDATKKYNSVNTNKEEEPELFHSSPAANNNAQTEKNVEHLINTATKDKINDNRNKTYETEKSTGTTHSVKSNESVTEDTNTKIIKNLLTFLKVVTDTISKNTKQSLKGKLRYLENLRDTIMVNIEQRIDDLFPDDSDVRRRSRSAYRTARGHHVGFPSSEGALMTLSFLTFAVFLIKLVLQVVHAYKNKTMVMPTVVATVGKALHNYHASD